MTDTETAAGLGHNRPAVPLIDPKALQAILAEEHATLIERRDELIAAEERLPEIDSDETAAKVTDYIRQITAVARKAEGARVVMKEPFLEAERAIDGFFKTITTPLDQVGTSRPGLKQRVQAKLTAYMLRKEAEERARREEVERIAREEERKRREEAEAAERAAQDDASLKAAIDANERAEKAAADRADAEKQATAKPADLSRVRGEFGAVGSLTPTWTFMDLDRATIDLEKLRMLIPMDGLERGVNAFIKSGGRDLAGVTIYEKKEARVR